MSFEFLVYLVLFFLGFSAYRHHKPAWVLVCLSALGSGLFKILPTDGSMIHPYDFMIFLSLIISLFESTSHPNYFKCKDDPIGKLILYILGYTSIVCFCTIVIGQELMSFALKVWRVNLIFLLYFYFRKQDFYFAHQYVNIMLVFSIIQGSLFYLQLLGVNVLQGGVMEMAGNVRYQGLPSMSVFFVLLAMVDDKMKTAKRLFIFFFFGGALLLSMNRGPVLTIVIAYGIYILVHRRAKNIFYLVLFAIVYLFAVAPMIDRRSNERSSGSEELKTILLSPLSAHNYYVSGQSGTVLYRMATLSERVEYLINNPEYLPFGIGTVHENSPKNQYDVFVTGLINPALAYNKETITSDDITWVNVIMRYGIIGVILFGLLYYLGARIGIPRIKNAKDGVFITGALLPLAYLFASMGTNHFDYAFRLLEFMLPLIIIRTYLKKTATI